MDKKSKLQLFLWLEAAVWILVLSLVILGFRYHSFILKSQMKSYQIFVQDVNGLIVGSPVRLMGTTVGHIEKIKIVSDHVYIKFLLDEKNLNLPQGTIASVESGGMGGSKSLELFPPNEESKALGSIIVVHQSMRFGEVVGMFDDMVTKLGSIISKTSTFVKDFRNYKKDVPVYIDENNIEVMKGKFEDIKIRKKMIEDNNEEYKQYVKRENQSN